MLRVVLGLGLTLGQVNKRISKLNAIFVAIWSIFVRNKIS